MDKKQRWKLALCMILKDEAMTIEAVIKAFHFKNGRKLYSRLIIGIDNSTTDDTEKIVRKYTDEVSFFKWEEDFSTPRNKLIEKVDIGWAIAFPDGHEFLRPKGLVALDILLDEQPDMANVYSPYIEIDIDEYDIPEIVFRRPIIFKNTGFVKFKRKVHNFLYDDKVKKIAQLPEVSFVHNMPHERKKMRSNMRMDMNVRILEKTTKKTPEDTRDNFYLADSYEEGGDLEKALDKYKKTFKLADGVDTDMATQTSISAMNCLYKVKKHKDAIMWGFNGMRNRPDRAELFHFIGLNTFCLGEYEKALHWYSLASLMTMPDTTYFLMCKVYSWHPWEGIMMCHIHLKNYELALEAAHKILTWKTNQKTGKQCPDMLKNIKNIEEAIGKSKNEILLDPKIMDNAADTIIKNYSKKADLQVV